MQIEVNIGLEINGIYSEENFLETINEINNSSNLFDSKLIACRKVKSPTGEETFVGLINLLYKYKLIVFIETLCIKLEQECIAVRYRPENSEYIGMLIYNPFSKNTIKGKFNKDLFVGFTDCAKLPDNMGYSMSEQN